MTIAQELKATSDQLAEARKERDGLVTAHETIKAQIAEKDALIASAASALVTERETVKAQIDGMTAEAAKVAVELATVKAELETAKAKLEMAAFKDVGNGQPPVKDAAAGQELDVVALVDSAEGAEKMRLYRQHKAAYDAAKR